MKEKYKKKTKIFLLIIGIITIIGVALGVSYALWTHTAYQESINKITSNCLQVIIEDVENSAISLKNAYPLTKEEAKSLVPYTFRVKNTCNLAVSYSVNLEILEVENQLSSEYIHTNFNEKKIQKLKEYTSVEPTYEENNKKAIEAYELTTDSLGIGESKTYTLKLWLDENVTMEDDVMNKNLIGKISVTGVIDDNYDARGTMMAYKQYEAFWSLKYQNTITKIVFEPEMHSKENVIESFNLSENSDGSVMGYLVPNENNASKYTLYIQSEGGVKAPSNSRMLFESFYYLESIEGLEYFDTSNVTNMSGMFRSNINLINLDLSNFDTSNVTNMSGMFQGSNHITNLDVSHFDTSNVTNMSGMFFACERLTDLDVSNFNTSKVKDMSNMFAGDINLVNLNLSSFDTSNVTNMRQMFGLCPSLVNLNISHFNTSNVTNMEEMFYDNFNNRSKITNLNLSNFNTNKVTNMRRMFYGRENLINLDISNFDTSNVTDMTEMFYECKNLNQINYGNNFIRQSSSQISNMFYKSPANKPTHESWNGVF